MKKTETNNIRIEIAPKTILLILGIAVGLIVLYTIRNVVMMAFFAFIITSAAIGPVKKLTAKKVPKWLAISLVYLPILLLLTALLSIIAVPFARETIRLIENLPSLVNDITGFFNQVGYGIGLKVPLLETPAYQNAYEQFSDYIAENLENIISAGTNGFFGILNLSLQVFGGVFTVISIITISVYLAYDHDTLLNSLTKSISKKKTRKKITSLIRDIETKLGYWLRGQLTVAIITGTLVWIALSILQLPYALPLAVFTAIMTNIPIFGAILSAIPPIIIALAGGNLIQIIGVPIAFIIIQQIENNVIAPRVMGNAVGIRPIVVILAILIGAELYGFVGILLAVPIAALFQLIWEFSSEFRGEHKQKKN